MEQNERTEQHEFDGRWGDRHAKVKSFRSLVTICITVVVLGALWVWGDKVFG